MLVEFIYYIYFSPFCLLMLAISSFPPTGMENSSPSVGKAASIPDSYSAFPRLSHFPSTQLWVASWWGIVWDIWVTCVARIWQIFHAISPLCFSFKGVLCCSSAFRFGARSFNAVDWRLSVVSQEFWKSDCTQSIPWGFWHCEWQGRQCSLSFCLSSLVGGKSHPAIPGFGLFSALQFIFPFHLLRKCMSHFRRSRSHPLQAVLKANSLLPFSLLLLLCPRVLSKNKELQMEHSSLCGMSSPSLPTTGSFIVTVLLLQQFSVFWNQIEVRNKEFCMSKKWI